MTRVAWAPGASTSCPSCPALTHSSQATAGVYRFKITLSYQALNVGLGHARQNSTALALFLHFILIQSLTEFPQLGAIEMAQWFPHHVTAHSHP